MIYYYPKLSSRDYGWFRVGGPGLANCLFFAANAYVQSRKNGGKFIEPTWRKFSIGPWLRHERDKRIYNRLFSCYGIHGLRKAALILIGGGNKLIFNSLDRYFGNFNRDYPLVREYLDKIIRRETIRNVPSEGLEEKVAVHVRLGDYLPKLRVDIKWYEGVIRNMLSVNPHLRFSLFSDGTDCELKQLLDIPEVERVFYGNAFADMYAISQHRLVIASDSTFSAWGAFMGQKPIIFSKRHFPPVYDGQVPEFVLGTDTALNDEIINLLH